jgi:hypothetical protein
MRTVDERGFRRQNGPLFIMKIYVKLISTAMFWGGTFVAGKVAAQNVGPFSKAGSRHSGNLRSPPSFSSA